MEESKVRIVRDNFIRRSWFLIFFCDTFKLQNVISTQVLISFFRISQTTPPYENLKFRGKKSCFQQGRLRAQYTARSAHFREHVHYAASFTRIMRHPKRYDMPQDENV